MARRSFFFVTLTICNILVRGQVPPPTTLTPTPTTSPPSPTGSASPLVVTFSPECDALQPKCGDDVPFPVGESTWWVGGIYVNPSAAPCTGASAPGTPLTPTPGTPPTPTPGTPPTPVPGTPPTPVPGTPPTPVPGTPPTPVPGTPPTPTPGTPPTPAPGTPPTPAPGTPPTPVPGTPPTPTPGTPPTPTPGTPPTPAPGTPPTPTPGTPPTPTPGTPPTPTPGAPATPAGPVNTDNKCSIFSYVPQECKSLKMQISRNEDGSICLKQATFNEKIGTVALFKNVWLADDDKAMFKSSFGYYGTLDKDCKVSIAESTPDDLKQTQSSELVLLGVAVGKEWALLSTCNKSVVFVLYADCVKPDQAKTFKAALDPILQQIQIKPEEFKEVPFESPIAMDRFILPLGQPAGPSGPAPGTPGGPAPGTPGGPAPGTPGGPAPGTPGGPAPGTPGGPAPGGLSQP